MTKNLPQYLPEIYGLTLMNKPYPYKLAKLRDYDKSLEKPWHVEYYIWDIQAESIKRRRVTLNQRTERQRRLEAKTIIKDINSLLMQGAVYDASRNNTEDTSIAAAAGSVNTLSEAIKCFMDFKKNVLRPRTHSVYNTDLKRFRKWLKILKIENLKIKNFTPLQALQFLDYLKTSVKVSNRSVNNNKDTCINLFNFYIERKVIDENPFVSIRDLPQEARRHTAFTDKQAEAFKKECLERGEHQLWFYLSFIYYAYLRPRFELRLLKVGDIKEKTILIRSENAKDKTTEHVMIAPALEQLITKHNIRSYPEDHYVFTIKGEPGETPTGLLYFYKKHTDILKSLKLHKKNLDTYSWKHTGVISLWRATQNMELIRAQCRHSNLATTQKYLRDLGLFVDYDQIQKFPEL